MRRTSRLLVVGAAAMVLGIAVVHADSKRWWSHVSALAGDEMEGRNTGSPAHKRAADYVASQFQKSGLTPVGGSGYLQPVKFISRQLVEAESSLALVRKDGTPEPLTLGEDANLSARVEYGAPVEAPLVFVGYGLSVPEAKFDDLADPAVRGALKGAVVVSISGGPSSIPGPLRAHYQSARERWTALQAAGAIGSISIANPKSMDVPWARQTLARLQPAMVLADASLQEGRGQQVSIAMNPAHADKLFAGSGHTFAELLALADAGKPLPRFPLPLRVKVTAKTKTAEVESQNVIAVSQGSDPKLRDQYVVLSAHLDHLGVGEPINGDKIYNGAMDNASGVAALLEIAEELHEAKTTHARSIMFVAVTGEEKGLLGSHYFVARPPIPISHIVANVNTDMFLPLFPLKTLMVLGLDESDLGGDIRAVANELKLGVQADPEPNRNRFIRSDQYSFIRGGVPALSMKVGYEENTPEAKIAAAWIKERYHAPSDDLNQPIDLSAAEGYVEVVKRLAVRIANRETPPKWNDTSFFKRFAGSKSSNWRGRFRIDRLEHQPIELRVRLPCLSRDDAAVAHRLILGDVRRAGGGDFPATVFVRGHALALDQAGSGENLHAVADAEDPLLLAIEFPQDREHAPIVPQILRRAAAEHEHRGVVLDLHLVERQIGFGAVAGPLDVGVPSFLEIMNHEMQPPLARRGDARRQAGFEQPMAGVETFVALARITRDDQDGLRHARRLSELAHDSNGFARFGCTSQAMPMLRRYNAMIGAAKTV
jgi:Zn-dependent M28 family amino/carboxypeptidase